MKRTDPNLLRVARGDAPADLVLRGGRVVNVHARRIEEVDVAIVDDRIAGLGSFDGTQIIELDGALLAPGFIDAHMHVESTMLTPRSFAVLARACGTTAAVLDPHEIANVLGIAGIELLMEDARCAAIDCFFTASSCVPASLLETAGASLSARDLAPLFDNDRIIALAEVMNYPGVVAADPDVLEKVELGLERAIVDGHAPGLVGAALGAYVAAGITSDHECTSGEEAAQKLALGMRIFIREGSAARNLDALLGQVTAENAHRCCFCTDDRHPRDLRDEGHIDHVVRSAVQGGLDPILAISMATLHPAEHYGLHDHGAITPGRLANLVALDDETSLRPHRTWFHGAEAAADTQPIDWSAARNTVHLPKTLNAPSLAIAAAGGSIRVIGLEAGQIVTQSLVREACVQNGQLVADTERDLLKMAVIERHGGSGSIGLGFVEGMGISGGAIASTVGHDAHNLAVIGDSDGDMLVAAAALGDCGGGQCVVRGGDITALLPLPIAGLMSDAAPETVIETQSKLLAAAADLGCPHRDPFMPLSFLTLSVIGHLKLTDQGLVDVDAFRIVDLAAT